MDLQSSELLRLAGEDKPIILERLHEALEFDGDCVSNLVPVEERGKNDEFGREGAETGLIGAMRSDNA